jgi:hypothetical protein
MPVQRSIRERVVENLKRELRSWICQVCAGELCNTCGRPLRYPLDFAIVTDSGRLWRGPWKGQTYGCVNPECSRFYVGLEKTIYGPRSRDSACPPE